MDPNRFKTVELHFTYCQPLNAFFSPNSHASGRYRVSNARWAFLHFMLLLPKRLGHSLTNILNLTVARCM